MQSSHVLERDRKQLASQVYARLLAVEEPALDRRVSIVLRHRHEKV
jgi:hypothetical protein